MKIFINSKTLILTGLSYMLMASCQTKTHEAEEDHHSEEENVVELTQGQYDLAEIKIGKAEKRNIGSALMVNGVIDVPPQNNISINVPYGGFIKYTEMLPGTMVKKGQLLARIENPDFIEFQEEYLSALARREYLKAQYERQKTLLEEKVIAAKDFQQAKSDHFANEAQLNSSEQKLKLIGLNPASTRNGKISASVNIYSPVSGSVMDVYSNIGKYIEPKDVIMDIANSEDLHVELTVYENDIPFISKGQLIRFNLANSPDEWREAEIFLVGTSVREDRSVTVHGHLKQEYPDLLPGMYVSAKIERGSHEVWTISEDAIVRFAGKHYIFSYTGDEMENDQPMKKFEMLEVTKGDSEEGFTEISLANRDLKIDDLEIVNEGAFTLLATAKNKDGGHGHAH